MSNKKLNSFIVALFVLFIVVQKSFVYSQTSTPKPTVTTKASPTLKVSPSLKSSTPSATPADVIDKLKQIQSLKEKIATKVAQLRENEKSAFSGIVKKLDEARLIVTSKKEEKSANFSDDTTFYKVTSTNTTELTKAKLTEGQIVTVFGYYNEDKSIFSAKYIYVKEPLKRIVGKIADIDKTNFTVTILGKEGDIIADIESFSKVFTFVSGTGKVKYGFSKLKVGDVVHLIGTENTKEKNRYTASFLAVIPLNITPAPSKIVEKADENEEDLSPTKTAKPSVTLKPTRTPTPSKTSPTP